MTTPAEHAVASDNEPLPTLQELGRDLLRVSALRRLATITLPFAISLAYAAFAAFEYWAPAVLCVLAVRLDPHFKRLGVLPRSESELP